MVLSYWIHTPPFFAVSVLGDGPLEVLCAKQSVIRAEDLTEFAECNDFLSLPPIMPHTCLMGERCGGLGTPGKGLILASVSIQGLAIWGRHYLVGKERLSIDK